MTVFNNPLWKTGIKDSRIYFEFWTEDEAQRLFDGTVSPEVAYLIGKRMVDNAICLGYQPPEEGK